MSSTYTDQVSPRIAQETALLREAAGGRSQITAKRITHNGVNYTALWVKNVRLSSRKFHQTSTDMLFLLPEDYPSTPPIGFYVNFMWSQRAKDAHFLGNSYHSAPNLFTKGWYWYCAGLAGGFEGQIRRDWRPTADPCDGHNLATLFIAARLALNTGEE